MKIYSQDIGWEFGIKNAHASNEKRQTTPDGRNEAANKRQD